ncbi:MAG: hypothetical protein ABIP94_22570 [Planctomycetota bacterium]
MPARSCSIRFLSPLLLALPQLLGAPLSGCVGYQADSSDAQSIAAEVLSRKGGRFTIDEAISLAWRQNPELRALEARARAAGAASTVPILVMGEWRSRGDDIGLMTDPIALLGLGSRGAAIDQADARQVEAVATLATARWRTAAAVVEAFAIDAALATLAVPDLALDTRAFERAGLASPIASSQLRAAQARADSERVELDRMRADDHARLRQLLGLPRDTKLALSPLPPNWLVQPNGTDAELLSRPDLALALARFRTADADFYKAVTDQYPSFQIGPVISLKSDPLEAMGLLQLPIGMHGLAEAARERRQAARDDLENALLAAGREATLADQELAGATALVAATAGELQASTTSLAAARAAIAVEVDAFAPFADTARMLLRDTMEHRLAKVALARARVARAQAYGWPRCAATEHGS